MTDPEETTGMIDPEGLIEACEDLPTIDFANPRSRVSVCTTAVQKAGEHARIARDLLAELEEMLALNPDLGRNIGQEGRAWTRARKAADRARSAGITRGDGRP